MARRRNDTQVQYEPNRRTKRKKPINYNFIKKIDPLTENQEKLFNSYKENKHLVAYGCSGTGKTFITLYNALLDVFDERTPYEKIYLVRSLVATREIGFLPGPQPLDAKILTPSGWTTMGQISVGDYVIGRNGKPTKVLGVYPKGKKLVYKITTTENTSTECCEDHLWMTKTFEDKKRQRNGNVKSTKQIIDTFYDKNGKINHYIPRNEPVHFLKNELPITPYVLGVILGDGSISNSISIANMDNELIQRIQEEVNELGCYLRKSSKVNNLQYTISTKDIKCNKPAKRVLLKNYLHELGLDGKKSYDKFIPNLYKYSSIEDRIELLRGLMDTDGTIKCGGSCSFTTVSKQLADDMIELVQSLGGRATYRIRNRINEERKKVINDYKKEERLITKRIFYDLDISLPNEINPFYISRKTSKFNPKCMHYVGLKSIEPLYEKETQCILVEDPEHLYITDGYIVTHNTHDDKSDIYQIPYKNMVKYMFEMPDDPSFEMLYGNLKSQGTISFWSTSFVRGTTLDKSIIIVDEFQNLNFHELDSIITRVGIDSKIMFCGDATQSDLVKTNEKNGIIDFMKILRIMPSFDIIEFGIEDICRSGLVKEYLVAKSEFNFDV